MLHRVIAVAVAFLALAPSALAADDDMIDPEVHAFVSQGFLVTSKNNFLARSTSGSFEFSEVGINFTERLADDLRLGLQLFSRDLGPIGDYDIKADWFYIDYRWRDWLGFRAGRTKLPFGLYNDVSDIDAARVSVLLPQSIYPIQNRDFLLAQTGVELYGYRRLGSAGALDYRAYGGTVFLETESTPRSPFEVGELTIPHIVGTRVLWETPADGLRLGGSVQQLRLDTTLFPRDTDVAPVKLRFPVLLWVASAEYVINDWTLAAEYSRWHVDVRSTNKELIPESSPVSERAYAMGAYRFNSWFETGAYFALLYPDAHKRKGIAQRRHDAAVTLRFDINAHWLLKLEGHYMNGTSGLTPALNDNRQPAALSKDWIVFLAKTTAYF